MISDKLNENRNDYYGSKYSEHVFKDGKVTDPNSSNSNPEDFSAKQFWSDIDKEDYMKKQSLSNDCIYPR